MGIRVYCPNGHKLNVKDSQAGRRGICPHCGAKFTIPAAADTAEPDEQTGTEQNEQTGTEPDLPSVSISVETDETMPVEDPAIPIVTETVRTVRQPHRRRSRRSANLVFWLTTIVVVLVIVFVWVVLNR